MKTLLIITCILLACQAVRADSKTDPTAGKAPAAKAGASAVSKGGPVVDTKPNPGTTGTSNAKVYVLAKKTAFTATANDHNPFWPIGWVKMESSSDNVVVIPHSQDFSVTSILLNEPPMAVINGKEMAEGEIATLTINGQLVTVQLMAVQDGRVILRWQNQNIVVPLHRDEELSPTNSDPPVALR